MKLTTHFTLEEFTKSQTAEKKGIDNTPNAEAIGNLKQLCQEVLEPLRQHFNVPIEISSGYRCEELNRAVGGTPTSQHLRGEAADIRLPQNSYLASDGKRHTDITKGREWMCWIINNTDFDQCIWETANGVDFWIHISCRHQPAHNRRQVIRYMKKHTNIPSGQSTTT